MSFEAPHSISDSQARPFIAPNSKLEGRACESAVIDKAILIG